MCFLSVSLALGTSIATTVGLSVSASAATAIGATTIIGGAAAIAGTAAAGVVGTVSAAQQADQQAALAKSQAQIEEQNALMANRRAQRIDMEANQRRVALLRESQQTLGTARAGYAASGVVLGSGVTLDYEADVADVFDLDMRNLDYDVKSQQWQQRVQATNHSNQALMYRTQAQNYADSKTGIILKGAFETTADTVKTAFSVGNALKSFMPVKGQGA